MNGDLLRIIDTLHRDKAIDKEVIFEGIEAGILSAVKKRFFNSEEEVSVTVDRETGNIRAKHGEDEMDPNELGRIAALTAKQVMMQKIREAERDVIFDEYEGKEASIVTGTVQRHEGPNVIVNLGRTEGILPRREQVYGETYQPGERLKLYIQEVKKIGQKVKIVLSRTHADLIKKLFEFEVPEVMDKTIEIKGIAREPGHRTKIAVSSIDNKVDAVGACVGVRGSRIKNIVDELNGEKIDIVRWNDSTEVLIMNSLKPAEISGIEMDFEEKKASVLVPEDQLSLAIGRKGQNVRLASKLTGWELDIVTQSRLEEMLAKEKEEEEMAAEVGLGDVAEIPGIVDKYTDALREAGITTLGDVVERGVDGLQEAKGIGEVRAQEIYDSTLVVLDERIRALEEKRRAAAEIEAAAKAKAKAEADAAKKAEADAAAAAFAAAKEVLTSASRPPAPPAEEAPAEEASSEDAIAGETAGEDSEADETADASDEEEPSAAEETPASEDIEEDGGQDEEAPEETEATVDEAEEEAIDETEEAVDEASVEEETPAEEPAEEPVPDDEEAEEEPATTTAEPAPEASEVDGGEETKES